MWQVIKSEGVGVMESPIYDTPLIEEVWKNKDEAEKRALELWLLNTTEQERNSGWCGLHYHVQKLKPK